MAIAGSRGSELAALGIIIGILFTLLIFKAIYDNKRRDKILKKNLECKKSILSNIEQTKSVLVNIPYLNFDEYNKLGVGVEVTHSIEKLRTLANGIHSVDEKLTGKMNDDFDLYVSTTSNNVSSSSSSSASVSSNTSNFGDDESFV